MERTLPLEPQNQAARLRRFGRVVFDGLPRFDGFQHLLYRNIPLKHTLNGMEAEEGFGVGHWKVILLLICLLLHNTIKFPHDFLHKIFKSTKQGEVIEFFVIIRD